MPSSARRPNTAQPAQRRVLSSTFTMSAAFCHIARRGLDQTAQPQYLHLRYLAGNHTAPRAARGRTRRTCLRQLLLQPACFIDTSVVQCPSRNEPSSAIMSAWIMSAARRLRRWTGSSTTSTAYRGPPATAAERSSDAPPAVFTDGWFMGVWTRRFLIEYQTPVRVAGVHFKPWGISPFAGVPSSELRDRWLPVDVVWEPSAHPQESAGPCRSTWPRRSDRASAGVSGNHRATQFKSHLGVTPKRVARIYASRD